MSADFSVERLLAPIPRAADPCGEPLDYAPVLDGIREARRADDPELDQGVWRRPLKCADWVQVDELCQEVLVERSKHLQVAAWLIEAQTHLHGLRGAERALAAMARLLGGWWDGLYPRAADERDATLAWLDSNLPATLVQIGHPGARSTFSLDDWEAAQREHRLAAKPATAEKALAARGRPTRADLERDLAALPVHYRVEQSTRARRALDRCRDIESRILERLGAKGSGLGRVKSTLSRFDALLRPDGVPDVPAPRRDPGSEVSHDEPLPLEPLAITSRREAYLMLERAAAFLERTEPHSPAPPLVRRAIRWGGMSLEQLLRELIRGSDERAGIHELLGLSVELDSHGG